jgi:protoporphyrinogen oxidase
LDPIEKTSVICIGAGPAGLTAAYKLAKTCDVHVLEADPRDVGGISRTIVQNGFCFDIGGHRFFSKSTEVVALWHEILGHDFMRRHRKSRIFYNGKFYPYPLDLWRTLANLGAVESIVCGLSYLVARLRPCRHPQNFEQWVTNQFGARLFRIFFKTYTEKVWGMKCTDIAADWAAQRIKGLSLVSAVGNALLGSLGIRRNGAGIKTLIEEFLYPRKGPGMMWQAAAQKITALGGIVELGCKVDALRYDVAAGLWQVSYTEVAGGVRKIASAAHVISSMPLKALVAGLEHVPDTVKAAANSLRYRDFLIVALILKDRQQFDDNWLYIHSPDVKVGRIQNFKAWSPDMVPDPDRVCYGMEYFCFEGDGLWNSSDAGLVALASRELVAIGLAAPGEIEAGYVVRQPKAYPVYDRDYVQHVDTIRQWLAAHCPNLQVVGRNGMHKYNNQDHSMMTAMLAAENILAGRMQYDVWQVNQDAQYHEQESAGGQRLVPSPVAGRPA